MKLGRLGTVGVVCLLALSVSGIGVASSAGASPAVSRATATTTAPPTADPGVSQVGAPATTTAATTQPNFVFILVDDATYRELPLMPKLQSEIAAHGTTFTHYFDSTPICCPARAGILSGQYNHNNKVLDNGSADKFDGDNQLARWLQTAGYQTSIIGKYLNKFPCVDKSEIPKGWTHWQQACRANAGEYNYTINDNGKKVKYGSKPKDYQVDVETGRMVKTIGDFSKSKKPFFIYVTPPSPHGPIQVPKRYKKTPVTIPAKSPAFNEKDMSDKPWLHGLKPFSKKLIKKIDQSEVRRMRMNLALDDMVDASVKALQAAGKLDNTVILVTNDNGFMRGEHRMKWGKGVPYYEAVNSGPLYIRGPGFPVGAVNPALVGNIDIAPTLVALGHAKAKRVIDGVNMMAAVKDPASFDNRAFYHWLPQWGTVSGVRVRRQVRVLGVPHVRGAVRLLERPEPHRAPERRERPAVQGPQDPAGIARPQALDVQGQGLPAELQLPGLSLVPRGGFTRACRRTACGCRSAAPACASIVKCSPSRRSKVSTL